MSRSKGLIAVFVLAAGLGIAFLLLDRSPDTPDRATLASRITLYGYAADAALTWRVDAEQGDLTEDRGVLSGVVLRFEPESEAPLTATADTLIRARHENRLIGEIRITRADGLQATTDELRWDESTDTLNAGSFSFSFEDLEAQADRLTYDLRSETAILSDNIRAERAGDLPLVMTGDRAEERDQILTITGNVVVETEEEIYRCGHLMLDRRRDAIALSEGVEMQFADGRLAADRLTVTTDGIIASGGVSIELGTEHTEEPDDA